MVIWLQAFSNMTEFTVPCSHVTAFYYSFIKKWHLLWVFGKTAPKQTMGWLMTTAFALELWHWFYDCCTRLTTTAKKSCGCFVLRPLQLTAIINRLHYGCNLRTLPVIGNPLLWGTKVVYCLPGAWITNAIEQLPRFIKFISNDLFVLIHLDPNDSVKSSYNYHHGLWSCWKKSQESVKAEQPDPHIQGSR